MAVAVSIDFRCGDAIIGHPLVVISVSCGYGEEPSTAAEVLVGLHDSKLELTGAAQQRALRELGGFA